MRCDASGIAIGAVLSQDDKPIDFDSEKLNDAKQKYYSYDEEFYDIVQELKKWRHYLMSGEFVLYTENHDLQYIMQHPKLNKKCAKWVEYLQSFTFVLKHINGQANKVADALSGRILVVQEGDIQVMGFKFMELYEQDSDFQEAFEACKSLVQYDRGKWEKFMTQDGLLFRNN